MRMLWDRNIDDSVSYDNNGSTRRQTCKACRYWEFHEALTAFLDERQVYL